MLAAKESLPERSTRTEERLEDSRSEKGVFLQERPEMD